MPLVDWPYFVRNTTSVHGRFINKKYISKYMKISKIGAMLIFLVLTCGFSIRILLSGYMELDYSMRMLSLSPTMPMYMVDSLTKNMFASIKISKIEAMLWGSQ